MTHPEMAIILKIESYDGEGSYLEVGGNHLRNKNVMYSSIYFKAGETKGVADYGYSTAKEARDALKAMHPNAIILEAV